MARRNMSGGKYRRKFNKARNRQRAINSPSMIMRGGFRF